MHRASGVGRKHGARSKDTCITRNGPVSAVFLLRDPDPPSDLEAVGINTRVGEDNRIDRGTEALGQGEEGIAGPDRVD